MVHNVGCCFERRAHLTHMSLLPKGQVPHMVPKVLQCCSPLPQVHWEFNQPPMLGLVSWVWLGMHTGVTSTNDTERSHFLHLQHLLSTIIITSYHHYTITYRLTHLMLYRLTGLHLLVYYASVQNNKIQ